MNCCRSDSMIKGENRLTQPVQIYIRNTGLRHSLLGTETFGKLMGHPVSEALREVLLPDNAIEDFPM